MVEYLEPVLITPGEKFAARLKYFAYGVVSVELELPFEAGWDDLVRLSSRFITAPEIEKRTLELLRGRIADVGSAFIQPYSSWLSEDYYIINVREVFDEGEIRCLRLHCLPNTADQIARFVRGESGPLAEGECNEALQASLSYYPTDLLVVGWVAAFVYDTRGGRGTVNSAA